jgi:hypothetical protein
VPSSAARQARPRRGLPVLEAVPVSTTSKAAPDSASSSSGRGAARKLSDDVVLCLENSAVLDAAQATKLRARGIDMVEEPVAALEIADDEL